MPTADYEARVETTIDRINASNEIHPDNKQQISDFKRDLRLDGLSDAWLSKLTSHLVIIAEHLGDTRFEDMDKEDVKDLVEWTHDRDVSDATVSAYKQVIKRFWRWLAEMPQGEHPEAVDWINTTTSNGSNGKLPKDLLTRDDVTDLKDACRNPRDRAFIAMLYETGARIGELIDLTVGDIEDHDHARKVVIDGKTGQRRLPLLESTPSINRWLNDHPEPRPDASLWCKLRSPEQLSYHYIRQKLLVRAKERAGLEKPVNPHHFRHSRATDLANEFKEAQLCEWFGWVQGSDVPAKYVHLSGRDIDNAYNKLHGFEPDDDEEDEATVQECPRCQELNEPTDRFCSRCGQALEIDAAEELEEAEKKVTGVSSDTDAALAMQLVEAIQDDTEEVAAFVEQLD
jgi:integrase